MAGSELLSIRGFHLLKNQFVFQAFIKLLFLFVCFYKINKNITNINCMFYFILTEIKNSFFFLNF